MAANPISLAEWSKREVQSLLGSMARYTRFVLFSKFFLIVAGVGLLGMVIVLPLISANETGMRIVFSGIEKGPVPQPKMTNPHFQGMDKNNHPYNVTAEYGLQQENNNVLLMKLNADVALEGASWLSISSDQGLMNLATKKLALSGNVHLFYDKGYEFFTEAADIDIPAKTAQGDQPVKGQGPLGKMHAKGFSITEGGGKILFTGPISMTLYPAGMR